MRRNLRLTLVLLLLYVVYMLLCYSGTRTLQNSPPYSVSELTDYFLVFVPTKGQTRSAINILAANADIIQVRSDIKDRLKVSRNSNIPMRSNRKVRPSINDRTKNRKHHKIQRHPKFDERGKKGRPKTLNAQIKIRRRSATQVRSTNREEKNISKAEIYKNTKYHPNYMSLPNHPEGSGLNNSRDVDTPNTGKMTEHKARKSVGTLSNFPRLTKTKAIPAGNGDQNKVHAQLEFRTTKFDIRNMSAQVRTGVENIRNASTHTRGIQVIIVAHGRSGSSFFGGIFNAHPDFFFIYEPLNQMKSILQRNTDEYLYGAEYVINSLLKCNFKDDTFLQKLSRQGHHRASCRPLVSPPFCETTYDRAINFVRGENWKLCKEHISARVLNKICRKHANIAAKILLESMEPADLTWILDISGSYPVPISSAGLRPTKRLLDNTGEVYVLYLVRDPRAMIFSRYRLGWVVPRERREYGLESGEAEEAVKKVCDTIEVNVGAVLLFPQRIKLIRYEELASNPEAMVKRLFRELRISPSKNVFKWIHSKTHGPVKMHAVSLFRNATVSINSWREKIPNKLLEIIEMRCERVMKYLGYLPTHGSQEILRDLRKPLYLDKIKNLRHSYQSPVI